ncbi:helix-turn-helix domain-containing protein [Corynebacterium choanae]|uniref:AlbA family DNA-binding domain-containing protein n=1 Tax=Corynebacterium choanae TaxID=1862358 RepID=UPI000F4FBF0B|nr:ATP-binding protein [Corynebacterium choanae]
MHAFAHASGGGVLLIGFVDNTGEVIGTDLAAQWLAQRINQAVSVLVDIDVRFVCGARLLVLYVFECREPVENTSGALR